MTLLPRMSSQLRNELFFTIMAYIPYSLSGISRSFSAFLLPQLRLPESTMRITDEEETWIGSLTLLTMPIGCLLAGIMMHYSGRRLCLMAITIPYMSAWIITAYASNVFMLYCETVLNGIGAGMTVCTTAYVAEISSSNYRGTMLSLEEPMFNIGIVACNVIVHFYGWQFSSKCFLLISITSFVLLYFLPESPNWLVMKGYTQDASIVLTKIRNSEAKAKEEIIEIEVHYELRKRISRQSEFGVIETNLIRECWKPLLFMLGLFSLHHGSGYNILVSYTVTFFQQLKLPIDNSVAAIIYSTESMICSLVSPLTTIYFDRRFSLGLSGFGMGVSMSVVAIYQMTYSHLVIEDKPCIAIPIIGMYAYNLFCSLGIMMMPFIMAGEVFPVHFSVLACGISGCLGNVIAGTVLKIFPYCLSHFGSVVTLCTLSLFCFLNVPYAWFATPETRGKSIGQIQEQYFSGNRSKSTSVITIEEEEDIC